MVSVSRNQIARRRGRAADEHTLRILYIDPIIIGQRGRARHVGANIVAFDDGAASVFVVDDNAKAVPRYQITGSGASAASRDASCTANLG